MQRSLTGRIPQLGTEHSVVGGRPRKTRPAIMTSDMRDQHSAPTHTPSVQRSPPNGAQCECHSVSFPFNNNTNTNNNLPVQSHSWTILIELHAVMMIARHSARTEPFEFFHHFLCSFLPHVPSAMLVGCHFVLSWSRTRSGIIPPGN